MKKPAYIIDTDVGSDIDDVWAIVYMLMNDADIRLINVSHDNTPEKAKIVGKILLLAERTDIPISVGVQTSNEKSNLSSWVDNFDWSTYPGTVVEDGAQAISKIIRSRSDSDLCILGLSPASTLSEVAKLPIDLSPITLIQMGGAIHKGYDGSDVPVTEWNVRKDITGFQAILNADWRLVLVPLDAADGLVITGEDYKFIQESCHWGSQVILSCYKNWTSRWSTYKENKSSNLFDLVTADVCLNIANVHRENLKIALDNTGKTIVSDKGKNIDCVLQQLKQPTIKRFMSCLGK